MSNGALTFEILQSAMQNLRDRVYEPTICLISPKLYKDIEKWQKHEKWILSHPIRIQKQIRLKDRIRSRNGYKKLPLPE